MLAVLGRQAVDAAAISVLNNVKLGDEVRACEPVRMVEPGRTR